MEKIKIARITTVIASLITLILFLSGVTYSSSHPIPQAWLYTIAIGTLLSIIGEVFSSQVLRGMSFIAFFAMLILCIADSMYAYMRQENIFFTLFIIASLVAGISRVTATVLKVIDDL